MAARKKKKKADGEILHRIARLPCWKGKTEISSLIATKDFAALKQKLAPFLPADLAPILAELNIPIVPLDRARMPGAQAQDRIPIGAGTWLTCRGYVRDIARGARLALESSVARGEALNLCEDSTFSIGMWSRMILEAAGSDAELVHVADNLLPEDLRATGTMKQHILASARRARSLLSWNTSDPSAALRVTVAWHLANTPLESNTDFSADDRALGTEVRTPVEGTR